MTRPHLVFISGTELYGKNGSSHVEVSLARALADRYDVTLFTRGANTAGPAEPFAHRRYQRPSSRPLWMMLRAGKVRAELLALHAERPIALVHAFEIFPVALYAEGGPWRLVITHHNMQLFPSGRWARARARRALGTAARIVCLNAAQAEILAGAGIDPARLEVIENGVDLEPELRGVPDLPPRYLLFAGRFEAAKGLPLLLDAYEELPASARPALVLAGDERRGTALTARARTLGATLTGWLDRPALSSVLRGADALLMPTFSEASPLLLLEALAAGVPVFAHDLPALAGALSGDDGDRAERLPIGDRAAWTRAIAAAPGAREAQAERVQRARRWAERRSWARVSEAYARVYAQALGLA